MSLLSITYIARFYMGLNMPYLEDGSKLMDVKVYNKLVRDNIPDIIKAQGKTCAVSVLSGRDYTRELKLKLSEEVDEYAASGEAEELADILEVVYALSEAAGINKDTLEHIRLLKRQRNGGFDKRYFLESVTAN